MSENDAQQQLVAIEQKHRQLAVVVVKDVQNQDLLALELWAEGLLEIQKADVPRLRKSREAISLTLSSKVVWPVVKAIALKTKRIGWDERSSTARLGLAGSGIGVALFGGKAAGIAALGTAIGVPLWVVLGAGSSFAGVLIEEIRRQRTTQSGK